ncbi:MAG: YbgC/FadM family acyl-CoA thioesterase [Candidatus Omnitrophota bacterium]
MKVKIYYHDTDCGRVVYYANYLKYFEQARTEFFEQRGVSIKELADSGTLFVVARQEADYKFPAFYGDILDVAAQITNIGAVKIEFAHEVKNQEDKVICAAKTLMVCVGIDFKPKALPEDIRGKLLTRINNE